MWHNWRFIWKLSFRVHTALVTPVNLWKATAFDILRVTASVGKPSALQCWLLEITRESGLPLGVGKHCHEQQKSRIVFFFLACRTPLHCAASCNNVQVCKFLVESGAAVFAMTYSDMQTAADKCEEMEEGYTQCSQFLYGRWWQLSSGVC